MRTRTSPDATWPSNPPLRYLLELREARLAWPILAEYIRPNDYLIMGFNVKLD
jgi:hypothetical protein